MAKYTIDVDGLPEGVRPVRFGKVGGSEFFLLNGNVSKPYSWIDSRAEELIVEPQHGWVFVCDHSVPGVYRPERKERIRIRMAVEFECDNTHDANVLKDELSSHHFANSY